MNNYLLLSRDLDGTLWALLAVNLGLYGFLFALILIPVILEFVLKGIGLFKMSKNAGFNHAWLSFIPFGQHFVEFLLPKKKFDLLFIKSKDRKMMSVITFLVTYPGFLGAIASNIIPVLGQIITCLIPIAAFFLNWKKRYDLIMTFYQEKDISMILSIIGSIFPLAYAIILMTLINKMPDYGYGNYYTSNITE